MGGIGSGRSAGFSSRRTVEGFRSLDVNLLHRNGWLVDGWQGDLSWSRGRDVVVSIGLHADEDRLHLSYRVQVSGGGWENVQETVRTVRVACHYGGSRPYFLCPGIAYGVVCERRVAKLYAASRYFLCRHCYRLSYACQREDDLDRAHRRANKLKRRLSQDSSRGAALLSRPRGMWRRTYDRHRTQIIKAEIRANEAFIACAMRLLNRSGQHHQWG